MKRILVTICIYLVLMGIVVSRSIRWKMPDLDPIPSHHTSSSSDPSDKTSHKTGEWTPEEAELHHTYDWKFLNRDGTFPQYEDENYTSRVGVDVSYHDEKIDWNAVKKAGISFAFIRIGYRGYGEDGTLHPDDTAMENIYAAQDAGLDVGCYFFSQAINEKEAEEEAVFVLNQLQGIQLQLPIVYDPEDIEHHRARTDKLSGEQITKNTRAFTEVIREAGYESMIYSNLDWEKNKFDLKELIDLEIWYADYKSKPRSPYHFRFWQYTEKGKVPGIPSKADINLEFVPK